MYVIKEDEWKVSYEARYWNCGYEQIAIVASVTKGIDWAAYVGATHQAYTEAETLRGALDNGAKLSEADARHFFPNIDSELRYRL